MEVYQKNLEKYCGPFVSESHNGNIIHNHYYYNWNNTVKKYYRTFHQAKQYNAITDETVFEIEITMKPPPLLCPRSWYRYGLSIEDIKYIIESIDHYYAYQLALTLMSGPNEPSTLMNGITSTIRSHFEFIFPPMKTLFNVFTRFINPWVGKLRSISEKKCLLCKERMDHVPSLPKTVAKEQVWKYALKCVPDKPPTFRYRVTYPMGFDFVGKTYVPIEYDVEHNIIFMCEAVPREEYESWPCPVPQSVVTLPVYIMIRDEEYILSQDGIFFQSPHSKPTSVKPVLIKNKRRKILK